MKNQLKALNDFVYKDKEGVIDNHFKNLPLKSKKLFLKIFNKHFFKKEVKWKVININQELIFYLSS